MKKLFAFIVLLTAASLALAAPSTINTFVAPVIPNRGIVQFLQGTDSAGVYKTLYTSGAQGSDCSAIWMTNSEATQTHLTTIQIVNTAVKYGGTAVTTTAGAGFVNGTGAQNMLTSIIWPGLPLDSKGNPFIRLVSGDTIQATFGTAFNTSTSVINLVASCADYQ